MFSGVAVAQEFERKELKSDGILALIIHHYPKGEVPIGDAYLSLCVWNNTSEWPLYVICNNATWVLRREGSYRWEWHEVGVKVHLIVRSNSTIFLDVHFVTTAPKVEKRQPLMLWPEELKAIEQNRFAAGFLGAFAGVGVAYYIRKRYKESKVEEVI